MPNPRDDIAFEGILEQMVTCNIDNDTIVYSASEANGSASVGLAVQVVSNKTVGLTTDGSPVFGKLIKVEVGNVCTVQYGGGMTLPGGASATLTPGSQIVGALGASSAKGYIRSVDDAGGSPSQAEVREAQKGRGTIMDATTTTAVSILL